jgi:serine/threonine protein phosphatase PrpC
LYRNVLFNVTAQEPIFEHLVRALENANRIVIQDVPEGGTTCTAVLILNDQLFLAHVGDTRAYVLDQSGELQQLTRDHSLVQRLIELGQLTTEEAENHEHRNVLYRALGQNDEIEVDHSRTKFSPGTSILLCSDGLWGMIEEERIAQIIQEAENPQAASDTLIELANQNGGTDNISAIVVSFAG